ncbi:hypothetical protein NQ314_007344 [Rhamnusium bicolor]|uniref:Uncharacterized protein n=1 Tax=Rhamnusium bicolor TaxID=1586634 RepID=A0AAV8YS99_9CUCU|nr:hypothetical protein NQ314_007344 [Rhamnusium bicolor]
MCQEQPHTPYGVGAKSPLLPEGKARQVSSGQEGDTNEHLQSTVQQVGLLPEYAECGSTEGQFAPPEKRQIDVQRDIGK